MRYKMTCRQIITILVASVLLNQIVAADVWQDIAAYNYGDDPNPCEQAEALLQETAVTQYRPIEDKLIAVLKSNASTRDGKSIACRFLQQIGTDRCIPAVSALLDDEILNHYARLVLERLESDAADKAMRDALEAVPDNAKIGILGSLGVRRDRKAVEQVSKLTASRNAAVAAAALETLGKIGGPEAAQQLSSAKLPKNLQPARMKAMVACARSVPPADAVALCQEVLAGTDTAARIAAMRQLTIADPTKASPVIADAIRAGDARIRKGAIAVVADTKGGRFTAVMTGLLGQLPAERRAELIVALGTRGDKVALVPVRRYLDSEEIATRRAAVKAAGKLGDAGVVRSLLAAADSPAMGETVTRAIVGMEDDRVDTILVDSLSNDDLKRQAIKACVARGCKQAVPALLKLAQGEDSDIRRDAWAALGSLAADKHMDSIMSIVLDMSDAADLGHAEAAIKGLFSRAADRSKCFEAAAARYPRAAEATKALILELGAAVGDSNALKLVKSALKSPDKQTSGSALRALAKWPNELAAADLLELAANASKAVDRIVALRGYIRIAGLKTARLSDKKRVEMLRTAMNIAARVEEKKQVIGALQNVKSLESLRILQQHFNSAELKTEAQMSAANLVWDMRKRHPDEVAAIAEKLADSTNRRVAEKAQRTLKDLSK